MESIRSELLEARGDRAEALEAAGKAQNSLDSIQWNARTDCGASVLLACNLGLVLEKIEAPRDAERAYLFGVKESACRPYNRGTAFMHQRLMHLAARRADCAGAKEHHARSLEIYAALGNKTGLEALRKEAEALRPACPGVDSKDAPGR